MELTPENDENDNACRCMHLNMWKYIFILSSFDEPKRRRSFATHVISRTKLYVNKKQEKRKWKRRKSCVVFDRRTNYVRVECFMAETERQEREKDQEEIDDENLRANNVRSNAEKHCAVKRLLASTKKYRHKNQSISLRNHSNDFPLVLPFRWCSFVFFIGKFSQFFSLFVCLVCFFFIWRWQIENVIVIFVMFGSIFSARHFVASSLL